MPRDVDWPSTPDAAGDVTPIGLIIAQGSPAAAHADLLVTQTKEVLRPDDDSELQFVVRSPDLGPVCLPCMVRKRNGATIVYYSHAGEWDEGDVERLHRWASRARSARGMHDARIELITDGPEPPAVVADIVSVRPRSALPLVAEPLLVEADPKKNGELLVTLMDRLFTQELPFDEAGLMILDTFLEQTIGAIDEDFCFHRPLSMLVGGFLGETVIRTFGGRWVDPPGDKPAWRKNIKVGGLRLDPMKRAASLLCNPSDKATLTDFYDHAWEHAETEPETLSDSQLTRISGAGIGGLKADEITESGKARIYRVLAFLAYSDEVIADSERDRLDQVKKKFELSDELAAALESEAFAKQNMKLSDHPAEREFLMVAMPEIVAADGVLDPKEEKRLTTLGKALHINTKQMIGWLRAMLEARAAERGEQPGAA